MTSPKFANGDCIVHISVDLNLGSYFGIGIIIEVRSISSPRMYAGIDYLVLWTHPGRSDEMWSSLNSAGHLETFYKKISI